MNIQFFKRNILPHIIAIVTFFIVSSVYFYPAWQGKSLQGHDVKMSYGKHRERVDFKEYEHKLPIWNGGLFGGMPEFISNSYSGTGTYQKTFYFFSKSLGIPLEVFSLFMYMLCFYLFLVALGISPWVSIAGAFGFGLSTYNVIIIYVGHYMKVHTLMFIPPTLGGIYLILKNKYKAGFVLTSFFLGFQIAMSHIQMIYYFFLGVGVVLLVYTINNLLKKETKKVATSLGVFLIALMLGVGANYSKLMSYYKYNKQSTRGNTTITLDNKQRTDNGLDRDYINSWSSGVSESMMMFIPNFKGGESQVLKNNKDLYRKIPSRYKSSIGSSNQYWGNQPFSGGPNYMGAVLMFFFILGVFLLKNNRYKWGVILSVILMIFLSWGSNFPLFTDLFIDYVPFYNKFRAPVSILAVANIFIVFYAIYTLYRISTSPEILSEGKKFSFLKKPVSTYKIISLALILFVLLLIVVPGMFNSYISDNELAQFDKMMKNQGNSSQMQAFIDALEEFRISIFRADAFRSLVFFVLAFISILLFQKKLIKPVFFTSIIAILILVDLWSVDTRYVDFGKFENKKATALEHRLKNTDLQIYSSEIQENPSIQSKIEEAYNTFSAKTDEEKQRVKTYVVNKNAHYRVMNLTVSTFNDNSTTNAHRSVGGYHAVKLKKYQDLIQYYISKMKINVLNMLNAKYFITQQGLQQNPDALGEAWFVNSVQWAKDINEEFLALDKLDTKTTVAIQEQNKGLVKDFTPPNDNDFIKMTEYGPDKISYKTRSDSDNLAVFSEVFYPGWEAKIDGKDSPVIPVNYVLRSLNIPKGEHTVEFRFVPKYLGMSNLISSIAFIIILVSMIAFVTMKFITFYKVSQDI